jgi:hypothetical protein
VGFELTNLESYTIVPKTGILQLGKEKKVLRATKRSSLVFKIIRLGSDV